MRVDSKAGARISSTAPIVYVQRLLMRPINAGIVKLATRPVSPTAANTQLMTSGFSRVASAMTGMTDDSSAVNLRDDQRNLGVHAEGAGLVDNHRACGYGEFASAEH